MCFQDLKRRGFRVLEELVPEKSTQPKGLHRTEALQTMGPYMQPKDSRANEILLTRQKLHTVEETLFNFSVPDGADEQQASFWQCLTHVTRSWFHKFQASGFDSALISQSPDEWLDVAATADPVFGEWLGQVYIKWGDQCLADVIAEFEDGEAEILVDNAFVELIYDFPVCKQ